LFEEGALTLLLTRDESFITAILQTFSKKAARILLDIEPRLLDQVPTRTIEANSRAAPNAYQLDIQAQRRRAMPEMPKHRMKRAILG
jgi:hypothetical protein